MTNTQEPLKETQSYAAKTLERIDQEGLAPTPEAYAVWFNYFKGANPDIVRAVDIVNASEEGFTQSRCLEIYQRFIATKEDDEDFVERAGELVSDTLNDMSSMMKSVQNATNEYSGSLEDTASVARGGDPKEIEKAIREMIGRTKAIIEENKALEDKLQQSSSNVQKLQSEIASAKKEALTDGLTTLPNRKCFDIEVEKLVNEAKETGEKLCLMMMDIDHFKAFNDNYGHQVGDQVLRLVARTIEKGIKGRDFAARYGGEEFSVILPETDIQGGTKVGDDLRRAVANKEVINRSTGETLGKITISIGIAELKPQEVSDTIIARADEALYDAKKNGRNRVEQAK